MTPLHAIGEWLRHLPLLIPLGFVRVLFVALPALLIVWVLTLPRASTTSPDTGHRVRENLNLWATLALLIQVIVYSVI